MARNRSYELDFGPLEKTVRLIEETPPEAFGAELDRRLSKLRGAEAADSWILSAALAAARSIRHGGAGEFPHGLISLASIRALLEDADPERVGRLLRPALSLVNREVHYPGFGPFRLLQSEEIGGDGKEGTLFSFLEAVRAGETDWADHRFAWLVRNLEKDQAIDLLLSSGLEGVTRGAHRVTAVVETANLLHGLGWDWAPVLFRPVVRHQASGGAEMTEYDACRQLVADGDLLRVARRRPPGQASTAQGDPAGFLQAAVRWAESEPRGRSLQIAALLGEGATLEDAGDLACLGATLLLIQECLRQEGGGEGGASRRVHLVTGVNAMRQIVRLGTPGQRILALLLAGWVPPAAGVRLISRAPDSGWWLSPAAHLLEPPAGEAEVPPVPAAWKEMVAGGQANGLLPLLSERFEGGMTAEGLDGPLAEMAPGLEVAPWLAVKLERSLADAYRVSRTPHRWIHRWAAALALSLWPRGESESGGLQGGERAG